MSAPAKVVVVSGGTFGIGRAITLGLARRGHFVVAFGLEAPQLSSIARNAIPGLRDQLDRERLSAELMEADVSRAADIAEVTGRALSRTTRPVVVPAYVAPAITKPSIVTVRGTLPLTSSVVAGAAAAFSMTVRLVNVCGVW